jgi:hypothetical protein
MEICSREHFESIGDSSDEEAQQAIAANAREADQEEEPMDPRQLVVTVVTARDVPVKTRAPKGGGLYVVVEFEGQVRARLCMYPICSCTLDVCDT